MTEWTGRRAVVVGGSSGIGTAVAGMLAGSGARVLITGRELPTIEPTAAQLGRDVLPAVLDLTSLDSIRDLTNLISRELGGVECLVVTAGASKAQPARSVTPEDFDEQVAVNYRGPFFLVQEMIPLFSPGGAIVFVGTAIDNVGTRGQAVYASSKAAVESLTMSLASELAETGIRVNCAAPGPTNTKFFEKLGLPADDTAATVQYLADDLPERRLAEPAEVASVVKFLVSPESSYINGARIPVDSGWRRLF
ncbi:NAD(P)-dependent dehydrogenase, short-chain alcohol dehydrogenase family [Actinopolyspora xinjiangensis]|uniref:NAD(P)-dependent dehydrogenase, short-chain alcohol dehydrogenase family n=1 Tax=Actinopolyspora xinjiangensis TaxID=405564 RepID=A0A1H0WYT0_9ACTN|nr:SDR family oxidoreductase [Actinopolyspora xinjiangensis]SDP95802.1 NAD(P)-dependent dehydrogenase, short-chain alcohol dehydrogenase family [Actinopolyspora xinjiangensis]